MRSNKPFTLWPESEREKKEEMEIHKSLQMHTPNDLKTSH
jgi:hypothetical protein